MRGRFEPRKTRKATKGAKGFRGLCYQVSDLTFDDGPKPCPQIRDDHLLLPERVVV